MTTGMPIGGARQVRRPSLAKLLLLGVVVTPIITVACAFLVVIATHVPKFWDLLTNETYSARPDLARLAGIVVFSTAVGATYTIFLPLPVTLVLLPILLRAGFRGPRLMKAGAIGGAGFGTLYGIPSSLHDGYLDWRLFAFLAAFGSFGGGFAALLFARAFRTRTEAVAL